MDLFRFWLDRGVDGFRLDVFNAYLKDDQFRDNPPKLGIRPFDWQKHIYDVSRPELMGALKDIRAVLNSYPERYAVGETFIATAQQAANYIGTEKLHSTFDFTFLESPWKAERFLQAITRWDRLVRDDDGFPNYVLSNHDVKRTATRYGKGEDDERLKVAAAMLLTLRGTPFMYYGEEIGMRDIKLKRSEILDPVGKHYWPFYIGRDGCRSPMQWDGSENAGFGKGKPWLKVHPNYLRRNVEMQKNDPESLLNFFKRLLRIRKENPVLRRGAFVPLSGTPKHILAYLRKSEPHNALVVLNFGDKGAQLSLDAELQGKQWQLLLSSKRSQMPDIADDKLPIDGNEASIYISGE